MKILIAMHDINDLGGIINHTENLIYGFRELGHDITLTGLTWSAKRSEKIIRKSTISHYVPGAIYDVSQKHGWKWIEGSRFYYVGEKNIETWKEYANSFDIVIWSVPVPTKVKSNEGNTDWLGLYELDAKQLAIIHDGNLINSYPHMYEISHYLDGIVCVHNCSFKTMKLDVRKALIFNPFDVNVDFSSITPFECRRKSMLSLQNFKGWKRTDDFIRSVQYIDDDIDLILAGDGIERRYMTSKDKCKKKYMNEDGEKIWDVAIEYGMNYVGYLSSKERDEILSDSRTLLDSSWSKKYASYGGHFNRVVIEAILKGVIPIARNLGMSGTEDGNGEVFKANHHYIMIPWDATAEEFADIINVANNLTSGIADTVLNNCYSLLEHFDRKNVSQDYIDFALGKNDIGWYNDVVVEDLSDEIIRNSDKSMKFFIN